VYNEIGPNFWTKIFVNLKKYVKTRIVSVKIWRIELKPTSGELIKMILTVKILRLEVLFKQEEPTNTG
jgi:hypothetical protein